MVAIPGRKSVSQGIRSAIRGLKQSIKEINQTAADLAKKGNYDRAQVAMAKGKQLVSFRGEVIRLEQSWKQVCGPTKAQDESSPEAPLAAWQYYSPIARALVALGGKASLDDLEAEFLRQMETCLHASNHAQMANGRERWQAMIRIARKHMFKEGWLSTGSGKVWEITAAGRRVAEKTDE